VSGPIFSRHISNHSLPRATRARATLSHTSMEVRSLIISAPSLPNNNPALATAIASYREPSSLRTALHMAAEHHRADLIPALAALGCDVAGRDRVGKTPAMAAAGVGDLACLRALVDASSLSSRRGASDDDDVVVNGHKRNAWTPLCYACKGGHLECVSFLLERGARVDDETKEGATALSLAAREGHADVVRLLLRSGADPAHRTANGRTALLAACAAGEAGAVRALLSLPPPLPPPLPPEDGKGSAAAEPDAASRSRALALLLAQDTSGASAWHEAAAKGHADCCAALCAALCAAAATTMLGPAAAELVDAVGRTAAHAAALAGDDAGAADVIRVLAAHGWDLGARDERGATPLYYACATKKRGGMCVRALLDLGGRGAFAGSVPLGEGKAPRSPVCIAAAWGHADSVEALVEWAGVQTGEGDGERTALQRLLSEVDADGKTALELAREHGREGVARLLEEVNGASRRMG
jgi:ankyrin repeat protein